MAGDAAFTVGDSVYWATFNDPAKSKVAGKVSITFFPLGPNRHEPMAWNDIWGWAIPKSVPAERKALAKRMLSDMMLDEEGQRELWKRTGAPPPNKELWDKIAKDDVFMQKLQKFNLGVTNKVRSAYYFEKVAGSTQGLLRCGDQGGDRQPRGHSEGPCRWCAFSQQRCEITAVNARRASARRGSVAKRRHKKCLKSYSAKSINITERSITR
jgi:ABC-type sugar transport system, periplasmic component